MGRVGGRGGWEKERVRISEMDNCKDQFIKYTTHETQEHHDEQLRKWATPPFYRDWRGPQPSVFLPLQPLVFLGGRVALPREIRARNPVETQRIPANSSAKRPFGLPSYSSN